MKVKKIDRVTVEEILKKISQYDIYRFYFGEFVLSRKYLNWMRGDKDQPSFNIRAGESGLYHMDHGNSFYRGNCFNLVQQMYHCDFNSALHIIDRDFGLGLAGGVLKDIKEIVIWKQPAIIERKKTVIQAVTKKLGKPEYDYWGRYELGQDDLRGEVHNIKELWVNKEKVVIPDGELVFGYLFDDKYWKIYRPFNQKFKWRTNAPIDLMYGLDSIKNCSTAIVVKSVKDRLVCRKFLSRCCAGTQNESEVAISDDNVRFIKENSERQIVIFDNEDVGVNACKFYNDVGFGYWNVPKRYYTKHKIKDPSDLVDMYGSKRLISEFEKKIKL